MYGRSGFRLLLLVLIVLGAAALGVGAYQAGLAAGATQVVATGAAPAVVPYYYGHPFGFGFGFFGFLGTLLFIFLIFAVIRAVAFGGRGRRNRRPSDPVHPSHDRGRRRRGRG